MQQVGLWTSTVALTLLIWVSADQLITESVELPVTVSVRAAPIGDLVVTLLDDAASEYLVTVSGRQSDVAKLGDGATRLVTLTFDESMLHGRELGPQSISLLDELQSMPSEFPGCTVEHVEPATVDILVDRRVERLVPVTVRSGSLDYGVDPQVDVTSARVAVLQSEWDTIEGANPHLAIEADSYMASQVEGEPIKLEVPLQMISSDLRSIRPLSVSPGTVTLRATLRRQRKAGTIQAVPVKFVVSANVWSHYTVEFRQENPPETLSVRVVGPPDEIDRLVNAQRKTFATIMLGTQNASSDGVFQFFKPKFNLPIGVELAVDQEIESFEIRLVPKGNSSGAADRGP